MNNRNLPPGCNSADGGIDHDMEAALEDLCNEVETIEEAIALRELLPSLRSMMEVVRQAAGIDNTESSSRIEQLQSELEGVHKYADGLEKKIHDLYQELGQRHRGNKLTGELR